MYLLDIDFSKLPLWLIVCVLVAAVILIIIALATGREVTFWPPKIGSKNTERSGSKVTSGINEDYGIDILTPDAGATVNSPIKVTGRFKIQPPAGKVIAIVQNEGANNYWPKKDVIFDAQNKTWHTDVIIDLGIRSEPRKIIIASVGSHAKALINYFEKTGEKEGISYNDIIREDIYTHGQVKVKVVPRTPR